MKKFSVFTVVTLIVWGAVGLQRCRPKDDQQGNNAENNYLEEAPMAPDSDTLAGTQLKKLTQNITDRFGAFTPDHQQ